MLIKSLSKDFPAGDSSNYYKNRRADIRMAALVALLFDRLIIIYLCISTYIQRTKNYVAQVIV